MRPACGRHPSLVHPCHLTFGCTCTRSLSRHERRLKKDEAEGEVSRAIQSAVLVSVRVKCDGRRGMSYTYTGNELFLGDKGQVLPVSSFLSLLFFYFRYLA